MATKKDQDPLKSLEKRLDSIEYTLKHILAVQLYQAGCTKAEIKAHLHLGSGTVVKELLKGVKRANHLPEEKE